MKVKQVDERGYTEFIICTNDVPALFAKITGVLAANSINILGAEINTMNNGTTLDIFQVEDLSGNKITDKKKLDRLQKDLDDVLTGEVRVEKILRRRRRSILDNKPAPKVPPSVLIDNEVSETFTVIDIKADDMPGLLYRISSTLAEMGLYIHLAKVSTKGLEAADIFYVRDIFGQKIFFNERLDDIVKGLYAVISAEVDIVDIKE
jgi:[protein-PII] uridylyltransferase